jgi:putative ABC transport system permease protein
MDVESLLVVRTQPFGDAFREPAFVDTVRERDLERLRSHQQVRSATTVLDVPLSGSGSVTSRKPAGTELDTVSTPYVVVDQHGLSTLGVELIAGRDFTEADVVAPPGSGFNEEIDRNVILTQSLADRLFPDGQAVGRRISSRHEEVTDTVIGVVRHMHNFFPRMWLGELTMLRPGKAGDGRETVYLVRARPGAAPGLIRELETLMIESSSERIVTVRPLEEVKREHYRTVLAGMRIWTAISVLMVTVTLLGIGGLMAFTVTERRREIGTRRALGATRLGIVRHFMVESWLIVGIGILAGSVLTVVLGNVLSELGAGRLIDWRLLLAGAVALWICGPLAALAPALKAGTVPPDIATRSV